MSTPEENQRPSFVLLVHGEVLIRAPLAAHLRGRGYTVFESSNAEEAISVLKESDLIVDLVFCDSDMSGEIDGVMLGRWIRDNRPETRCIVARSAARDAAAAADECLMIEKPYDLPAIGDLIAQLLSGSVR